MAAVVFDPPQRYYVRSCVVWQAQRRCGWKKTGQVPLFRPVKYFLHSHSSTYHLLEIEKKYPGPERGTGAAVVAAAIIGLSRVSVLNDLYVPPR